MKTRSISINKSKQNEGNQTNRKNIIMNKNPSKSQSKISNVSEKKNEKILKNQEENLNKKSNLKNIVSNSRSSIRQKNINNIFINNNKKRQRDDVKSIVSKDKYTNNIKLIKKTIKINSKENKDNKKIKETNQTIKRSLRNNSGKNNNLNIEKENKKKSKTNMTKLIHDVKKESSIKIKNPTHIRSKIKTNSKVNVDEESDNEESDSNLFKSGPLLKTNIKKVSKNNGKNEIQTKEKKRIGKFESKSKDKIIVEKKATTKSLDKKAIQSKNKNKLVSNIKIKKSVSISNSDSDQEEDSDEKEESSEESSVISVEKNKPKKTEKIKLKITKRTISKKENKDKVSNKEDTNKISKIVKIPTKLNKILKIENIDHDLSLDEEINKEKLERSDSNTNSLDEHGEEFSKSNKKKSKKSQSKPKKDKKKKEKKEKKQKPKKEKIYTKFVKGKYNPFVYLLDKSECLNSSENKIIEECCVGCNNRNVIRAVNNNNKELFQECINATDKISSIFEYWSPDSKLNIFEIAIKNNNREFLTEIIKYLQSKNKQYRTNKPQKVNWNVGTGSNSYQTFGTYTRKLNMSRGNRMGINAFMEEEKFNLKKSFLKSLYLYCDDENLIKYIEALQSALKSKSAEGNYHSYNSDLLYLPEFNFTEYIHEFALHSNKKILTFLLKRVAKLQYYGFNTLHYEVLDYKDSNFQVTHKVSLNKKSNQYKLTPVHLAALNPCGDVLRNVVSLGGDLNSIDCVGNKPIHFASICSGSGPIEYFASINSNFEELNQKKYTPLLLAAKNGKLENIKVICGLQNLKIYAKNKKGMNAICLAACYNHPNVIEYLVKEKGFKIDTPGKDRKTALMFAAAKGHIETVKKLLELGSKVRKKDKFKRTALIHAVKSGQTVICSILLRNGAEFDSPDSSNNFPLHYACAYGWKEIIQLLLQAGAEINKICDWNITPLEISILNKHTGLVYYLLENSPIDVNAILNGGNTLLLRYMENLSPEIFDDLVYLIEKKKANVNVVNNEGKSPIYFLAGFSFAKFCEFYKNKKYLSEENLENSIYSYYAYEMKRKYRDFNISNFYNKCNSAMTTAMGIYSNSAFLWAKYYQFINKVFDLFLRNNCILEKNQNNFEKIEVRNIDAIEEEKNQENLLNDNAENLDKKKENESFFDGLPKMQVDENEDQNIKSVNSEMILQKKEEKISEGELPSSGEKESEDNTLKLLFVAINSNNYAFIERFLEINNSSLDRIDQNGDTIFHHLSEMLFKTPQNSELIQHIINYFDSNKAKNCINHVNKNGLSPIIYLFLKYYDLLQGVENEIYNKEILKEELRKFSNLKFQTKIELLDHINNIQELKMKQEKWQKELAEKNLTNELQLIDPDINNNNNNIINNIQNNNGFGGKIANSFNRFKKTNRKGRMNGKKKRFADDEGEENEMENLGNAEKIDEIDEEAEKKKLLENVILENPEIEMKIESLQYEEYFNKLNSLINYNLLEQYPIEKFFKSRKICTNANENLMQIDDFEVFERTILSDYDHFDEYMIIGFILNSIKLELYETEEIKKLSKKKLQNFIDINFTNMFRKYVELNANVHDVVRKLDKLDLQKNFERDSLNRPSKYPRKNKTYSNNSNFLMNLSLPAKKSVFGFGNNEQNELNDSDDSDSESKQFFFDMSKKKWNLLLFLSTNFSENIFNILMDEFSLDINYCDLELENIGFLLAKNIDNLRSKDRTEFIRILKLLVAHGLNINQKNKNKENLFLVLGSNIANNLNEMKFLADNNIDVNSLNKNGRNLLLNRIYNCNMNLNIKTEMITLLENFPFDINLQDECRFSFLHYLIISLSRYNDLDMELLQKSLSMGANPNLQDKYGRTPLHYLFIDYNRETTNIHIDPIVYLSTLLEVKDIDKNIKDYLGNIPLHYAAQRGSTICAMSLYDKDFINCKNKEGNTPMAYALLNDQVNIATYFFQQNSNIEEFVYPLWERNIDKYLKIQERELLGGKEEEKNYEIIKLSDTNSFFEKKKKFNEISEKDSESSENDDLELENYHELSENEYNELCENDHEESDEESEEESYAKFGTINENYDEFTYNKFNKQDNRNNIFRKDNNEFENYISIFRFTVKKNHQGLMYLFVNSGFDLMIAIQECIVEKKISLAVLLLDKSPYSECYRKLNSDKQNLLHILGLYSDSYMSWGNKGANDIFEKLISKGIDLYQQDNKGNTPLHYACLKSNYELTQLILIKVDLKKNNSILNKNGISPFICFLKNLKFELYNNFIKLFENIDLFDDMKLQFSSVEDPNYKCSILIYLLKHFNKVESYFKIKYFKDPNENLNYFGLKNNIAKGPVPVKTNTLQVNNHQFINIFNNNNYNQTNTPYKLSTPYFPNLNVFGKGPKLNYNQIDDFENTNEEQTKIILEEDELKTSVFSGSEFEKLLKQLISFGADLTQKDSNGLDFLFHCVKDNNFELIKLLFINFKELLSFENVDNEKKSLLHYVISPVKYASYENTKLLKYLISNGFKHDIKDKYGKSPIDYSLQKKSNAFLNCFKELNLIKEEEINEKKEAILQEENLNNDKLKVKHSKNFLEYYHDVDYHKDAEISIAENIANNKNIIKNPVLPDPVGNFNSSHNLVVKEVDSVTNTEDYYDVTLTNVHIMNGIYGQYLFYKMQIVHDVDRNVYILWNRWGMIGETGAYQRTPFISLIDAKTEFKKIFKSKTLNEWENKQNFEKHYGKYMLLKFKNSRIEYQKLLKPFDFKTLPKSEIKENTIYDLIKEFTNSALYFKTIKLINIDESKFNIEFLDKNLLTKAEEILEKIKSTIIELESYSTSLAYDDATIEKIQKLNVKLYEFSDLYYELIPRERFKNQPVKPICRKNELGNELVILNTLSYFENTIKLLIGSIYQSKIINPIDYILSAMKLNINLLKNSDFEYSMLIKYIQDSGTQTTIKNIFKISKIGESETFNSNWDSLPNHTLLFHGSKVFNFIGILMNGLKISPHEAISTGNMYGKGIYFSDNFGKSYDYCDYFEYFDLHKKSIKNKYMLICEVALGKVFDYEKNSKNLVIDDDLSFLKDGYNSMYVRGGFMINPDKMMIMDDGVKIPTGGYINSHSSYGGFSEYIVYDTSQVRIRYVIQIE